MSTDIRRLLKESIQVKQALFNHIDTIQAISDALLQALKSHHKILLCGNGGSAADAQHVAAEFVGRFARERAAWPAMALTTNTSILTAIGNDYSFDRVFARQVEAFAVPGDVIVGISTSGNAANVIAAMKTARELGCQTIGFTGENGGRLKDGVDICLHAPSNVTARIQEVHIVVWHIVCEMIEQELSAEKP
jgi:D-sedoheptulose 7-phosphate isomerase